MTEMHKAVVILDGYFDIDYKYKRKIVDEFDGVTLKDFADFSYEFLSKTHKKVNKAEFSSYFTEEVYKSLINYYDKEGITVLTESLDEYPFEFRSIDYAPVCLYLKGNLSLLKNLNKISIVGSRKTLQSVLKITEEYAKRLSKANVVIVTGVADGGDLSAIKGALESKNIICILAGGFNCSSKEFSREYINKVEKRGLLLTEHSPKVITKPFHYPIRNRLIAGLSKGTLIVSGNIKSGTRYTYDYALQYGKDVFAFPYGLGVASGEICNEIIKNGGYLVTDLKDITEVLGFDIESEKIVKLSNNENIVLTAIKNGKYTVDDIIEETSLKVFEILPILTSLEIKNLIVKNGSAYSSIKN